MRLCRSDSEAGCCVDPKTFDPTQHPASLSDLQSLTANYGIYSSANWCLDLKGLSWTWRNGRSTGDLWSKHCFGISPGTMKASVAMITRGRFDVEYGATLRVSNFCDKYWYVGAQSSIADPFLFRIHGNGAMERVE